MRPKFSQVPPGNGSLESVTFDPGQGLPHNGMIGCQTIVPGGIRPNAL